MNFETQVKLLRNSMEFTHGIRRALMSSLALIYFLSFGFDVIKVTTLFAVSTIIMTFFEFPTGAIADYDSRKKSVMISFLLFSISFLGLFLFKSFWVLGAFRILGDIAFTFTTGAASAWAIDALEAAKDKILLLKLGAQSCLYESMGQILGGIAGFLIISINFKFVWLIVSVTNLLMFFVVWRYMEERNFTPEIMQHNYLKKIFIKIKESFSYIIHENNTELRALMSANILGIISTSALFVSIPLLLVGELGIKEKLLPILFAIFSVINLIAPFISEKIATNNGFRIVLFLIWIILGLSTIIFGVSNIVVVSLIFLALIQFLGPVNGIVEGSAMEMEFSSKIRASLGSIGSINWAISNSIGVFLAGIGITYYGPSTVIIISGVVCIFVAIIYYFGMKK